MIRPISDPMDALSQAYQTYVPTRSVTEAEVLDYMQKQLKEKQRRRAVLDSEIYLLEITIAYVENKKTV